MKCDCEECRALAGEISANAEALSELRGEGLPRRPAMYPWIAIAAALLLAVLTGVKRAPRAPVQHSEPLKIKMLTPDPDVVIYWLVDAKKEEQR